MRIYLVALRLSRISFSDLAKLSDIIIKGFNDNTILYPSPNPTMATVSSHLANLRSAIKKWGTKGNRGSHKDYLNLLEARDVLRDDLTQLVYYAQNITPGNRTALARIGWALRGDSKQRIGKLEAVRDLHQFISRTVSRGMLKLKWEKPLNTASANVKHFRVLRSETPVFAEAKDVGVSTKTSFIDENPGNGIRYYWVIPVNAYGDGVESDVCMAAAIPVSA